MKKLKIFLLFISIVGNISINIAQIQDDEIIIPDRKNAVEQQEKPYVILISVDGFRHDYFEKYNPEFLNQQKEKGVFAEAMIPSFPSVTFPNHYTIVTGMLPPHHGLVGNNIYNREEQTYYSIRNKKAVENPDWYGGFPLWSLAESQNLLTACYYWPGSEAPIKGFSPTYHFPYSERKTVEKRIEKVKDWLNLPAEKRPHFITFYMPDVDHAGHRYGPDALETEFAVKFADATIQKLVKEVNKTDLPVNFIFVSDHGMTAVDVKNPIQIPEIDSEKAQIASSGTYLSVFTENEKIKDSLFQVFKFEESSQYKTYLKADVPEKYKFSSKEDKHNRIGDLVLIAEAPYYFARSKRFVSPGAHGYLPEDTPEMNTVFLAWGPDFQKEKKIKAFKNIHVFPLLAELLELEYNHKIDGDKRLIPLVLKKK